MSSRGRFGRVVIRIVTDEYLDLYILGAVALVFTILGFVNVVSGNELASVTVALLAVLAYSQIRSRRHVAAIAAAQRSDPWSIFRTEFPADLDSKRASASSLLVIGVSATSAVHGPSLTALRQMLRAGGTMRVMLLDPTDDALVRAASVHRPHGVTPDLLRKRIESTLDELAGLRDSVGGYLEIRVAPFVPQAYINVVDADSPNGWSSCSITSTGQPASPCRSSVVNIQAIHAW